MIFPFLNGLLDFEKAPATWGLFFINLLFLLFTLDQPNDLENKLKNISDDKYFISTQSKIYLNYINEHRALYGSLHLKLAQKANEGKEEQLTLLGQLAFRDKAFLDWALKTENIFKDQVAATYWKKKTKSIHKLQDKHISYQLGVSVNDYSFGRWFSYQFIHSGFMHFLGNMIFLFIFGCALEPIIGAMGMLLTYFSSGMLGAGIFLLLSGPSVAPLVGASGAVSGVMALFAFLFMHRKVKYIWFVGFSERLSGIILLPAWISFVMWFVADLAGFISSSDLMGGVAYSAHLGGELMGVLAATVLYFTRFGRKQEMFV